MDNAAKQHFRKLLIQRGKELSDTIALMKEHEEADQDKYSPNELSNYDNHPAEIGTELFQVQLNNALMVHEEHLLNDIHDALKRIDHGTFGICAYCGKDIKEERLEAIPYTRVCMECEQGKAYDPEKLENNRPVEELIWDAPFGRKYLNRREDDENEGLDQLNDLVKYGTSDSPQDMGGYHDYDEYYTNEIDNQGIVDHMDKITNEEYKRQLPD
ncbi:MAG: TraR/DksA C4-type zinc finger protein [Clostridia bacterium]|nr:TraR/DksA C4-type zinc finger protein [Clostridia bacterium]